jgi:hypothetical protein
VPIDPDYRQNDDRGRFTRPAAVFGTMRNALLQGKSEDRSHLVLPRFKNPVFLAAHGDAVVTN